MLSHIMVGSNDIARSRNSTMLCLSQWALAGCRGRKWPATLHAQWRAFPHRCQAAGYSYPWRHDRLHNGWPCTGRRMAQSRRREWRYLDRGPAWCAPGSRRRDISRLSSRSRWQPIVRPLSQASCLSIRRSKLRRAALFGRSSRAKELCGARFGLCRGSDLAVLATTGVRHFASAIVYQIAQPNRATLQHLAALQLDGANRRCNAGILVARVEDARRASRSIDGGTDRKADLVDQAGP